jgi:hypothetical protein
MTAGFWILAGLALQASAGQDPGTVRGVVRDAADGRPLANALVTLVRDDRSTITDQNGYYVFHDVAAGESRVRASRLDFQPLAVTIDLPEGRQLRVDFLLTLRPVEMPVVEARASTHRSTDSLTSEPEPAPVGTAVVQLLDATPGVAETGIAAAAKVLLGPDPPAPDNVLFVRGAGAALDLILLDGAPVQAPFHLGGLVQPSVTPSVVRAERLQGGVSPRWDGGLSDVLRLDSRPGSGSPARGVLYVDFLSAGGQAEGGSPGRASWLVSMRGVHGAGTDPFVEGGIPQEYADGLVRLDVNVSETDTVIVSGFWNRETVHLDQGESHADSPSWGNKAGALRYRGDLTVGRSELGIAFGEFQTRLPIGVRDPLTADGVTRRTRLTADVATSVASLPVGYGFHFDRLDQRTGFRSGSASDGEPLESRQRAEANALSAYVEAGVPVGRLVRISAGLRATSFSNQLGSGVSPRLRADVLVSPELLVSFSAGRYRQLLVSSTARPAAPEPTGDVPGSADPTPQVPSYTGVAASSSDHLMVAVTRATGSGSEVRLEGYWKNVGGLPDLYGGRLRYAGLDVWLRQNLGAFQLWGSYSLGWGWAATDGAPDTELYSGRHLLRGGFTKGFNDDVRLDAELSYGQGLEFGAIPRVERGGAFAPISSGGESPGQTPTPPSSGPTTGGSGGTPAFSVPAPVPTPVVVRSPSGSYLRLNVQATAQISARFFGRQQKLYPYFRIINALDRNDALFYRSAGDPDLDPRPVGAIPILPVLGIEWRI